jgi:hypothetical protein
MTAQPPQQIACPACENKSTLFFFTLQMLQTNQQINLFSFFRPPICRIPNPDPCDANGMFLCLFKSMLCILV